MTCFSDVYPTTVSYSGRDVRTSLLDITDLQSVMYYTTLTEARGVARYPEKVKSSLNDTVIISLFYISNDNQNVIKFCTPS